LELLEMLNTVSDMTSEIAPEEECP